MNATNTPTASNDRHLAMAMMFAAGHRNRDIARALRYDENRVSILRNSPLMRAQVEQLQRDMRERTFGDVIARLQREAGPTLDVLLALRDTSAKDDVRLGAARELFDRQVPKVTRTQEDRTLRIEFGLATLRQMAAAVDEADDDPPALVGNGHEGGVLHVAPIRPVVARSLDDVIAAHQEDDR